MRADILVVDDDDDIREVMTEVLTVLGYQVAGVANGLEALGFLRTRETPRLIFLDLRMPVMNGPSFLEKVKEEPQAADIPVVIISAEETAQERIAAANVAGRLKKPFDFDDLAGIARKYCGTPARSPG